jgi:hypothetical protein
MQAFLDCFKGSPEEVNYVTIEVAHQGADTVRSTTIKRGGVVERQSELIAIRRS